MSKIGKSILITVSALLITVVIVLAVLFLALFVRVETSNLKSSSSSSANVLRFDFHSKENDVQIYSTLIADDAKFNAAMSSGSGTVLGQLWDGLGTSEAVFAVFTDITGNVLYASDNCPVNAAEIVNGLTLNKIQIRTSGTECIYNRYGIQGESGVVIVGYSYTDPEIVDSLMEQTSNHATIFCGNTRINTTMITESGERAIGTTMSDKVYDTVINKGDAFQNEVEIFGEEYMATYEPLKDENGIIIGALFTGTPMAESLQNRSEVILISVILAIAMLILAAVVFIRFVQKHIAGPIQIVRNMAVEMEKGNLKDNPGITGKLEDNEVGELAQALSSAVKTLDSYVSDISAMMKEMSGGNFTHRSNVDYRGDFINIGQSTTALQRKMKEVIDHINISADSVYSGSEQVSSIAGIIADGTTKQAAASEELSASIAEISQNIVLNSESAEKAQKISHISIENINSQSEQIKNMLEAMSNIQNSTNEISKIIKSIEDIAFQTNILALNAAVEAARAGEAGKGFAVVADEVRNLANKSAEAAQNTSVLIENCVTAVNNGSKMAKKTAEVMTVVVENANNTNKLIDDINQQTALQAEAVKQVKSGVDMISEVVQQNSATAEESAANCQDLNSQAMTLRERISIFKV